MDVGLIPDPQFPRPAVRKWSRPKAHRSCRFFRRLRRSRHWDRGLSTAVDEANYGGPPSRSTATKPGDRGLRGAAFHANQAWDQPPGLGDLSRQYLAALVNGATPGGTELPAAGLRPAGDGAEERPDPEDAGTTRAHALGLEGPHSAATKEHKGCGTRAGGRPSPARPEQRTLPLPYTNRAGHRHHVLTHE